MPSPNDIGRCKGYIDMAAHNGINMILTPIFTPPLDTEIGGERPTVQLVDIKKTADRYSFGFEKLHRFIKLCEKHGIRYFEMAHLFTQWGAKYTPKIMADADGEYKRIFGWDVSSDAVSYENFLSQFLPSLIGELKKAGVYDRTYFHISDEPDCNNIEQYMAAKAVAEKYINGCKIMDALSHYEFYERGIVPHPVVATSSVEPYLEHKVPGLWVYYCCGQTTGVSNRFIAMPSCRNRSIAAQLYKFNISGFLQWGYNFYYSQYSRRIINPYYETDADGAFPADDAYSVYPADDGAYASLRLAVFHEALQDLSAMQLLESALGHEAVVELLERSSGKEIRFDRCADTAQEILAQRTSVNLEIERLLC